MLSSVRLRGHADANLPLARLSAFRARLALTPRVLPR
jgi:hypothetical protein